MQNGHRSGNPFENGEPACGPEALSIARGGEIITVSDVDAENFSGARAFPGARCESGRTGHRIAGSLFPLFAGKFGELASAHLQQTIGVLEVVIVMADGEHGFAHLLHQRQQDW